VTQEIERLSLAKKKSLYMPRIVDRCFVQTEEPPSLVKDVGERRCVR
jgi:hypothetical protein